jgi:hypothetical protein
VSELTSLEWLTVDGVLAFAVLEALVLAVCCRRSAHGPSFAELAPNLTAGLCLMLALRASLAQSGWHWMALWLALAGLAHAVDLWFRWRRSAARAHSLAGVPLSTPAPAGAWTGTDAAAGPRRQP